MKTKFNGILTLLLAFVVQFTFAQEKVVSGVVSDEMGPVADISVVVKGTTKGTVTDFDGKYSIKAKKGDTLVFSHISYGEVEKVVGDSNTINVSLSGLGQMLEEVVINAGYDVTKTKPKTTIAVTTISAETIDNRPNTSLIQTLQGQAAGLSVVTENGQPGAKSDITIRGYGSINGKTEPLIIVDGVIVDSENFKSINPNDYASVSVLKDAGATAIYGNRGANGVILLTTKSGKFNSPLKIKYSYSTQLSTLQGNNYDLMNSKEQLNLEKLKGVGFGSTLTDAEIDAISTYANTNWQDVFFRTGVTQNHNISLTGGGDKINTYTSFAYTGQEGILKQSDLKRFNVSTNINGKSDNGKFQYGTSLKINYSKSLTPNQIGSGAINRNYVLGAFMSVPYVSPHQYEPGHGDEIPVQFYLTPIFLLDRMDTYTRFFEQTQFLSSVNASYKILDNLTFSSRLSSNYTEDILTRAESPISFNAQLFAETGNDTPGFQQQSSDRVLKVNFVNSLNYDFDLGDKHSLSASIFTEYYKAHLRSFGFFQRGLDPNTFFPGDGSAFIADNSSNDFFIDTASADYNDAGLFSYFGTMNYDYNSKYGLNLTLRRDASYRFKSTNRWGTFWSVGGRWNIDKESFMEGSKFDMLKLRMSYGTNGNQNILGSSDFSANSLDLDLYVGQAGYGGTNSLVSGQIGNPNLKWEVVTQANIGLDFAVFNRRLDGSIDVYKKVTTDVFDFNIVSSMSGVTGQLINSEGSIENTGVDLTFNYGLIRSDSGLNIDLNFAGNYNKGIRYLAPNQNLPGVEDGGIMRQFFDYRYAGVNPENGNLLFLDADGNLTENPNTDTDRVFLNKNSIPDYQGSFGFDVDYKGIYLQTQFNYVVGVYRYDFDYSDVVDPTSIGQFRSSRDLLRAWTPTNRFTDIPSLNASNISLSGTRFLQNADYLRLRFVKLGYGVPKKYLDKINLKSLHIFVGAENYYTFTGWRGYDAEGQDDATREYPTPKTLSLGVELSF